MEGAAHLGIDERKANLTPTAGCAQIRVIPDHRLNRVTKTFSRGSITRLGALATASRVPLMPRNPRWPR